MILEDLYYTESHEWVKVHGEFAYIGISDFAQHELGDIVYVELPEEGDMISLGDPFGSVEAVKAVEDILAPISGEVVKVNTELDDSPDLINKSPYDEGWLIKIRMKSVDELENLMNAKDYGKHIQ